MRIVLLFMMMPICALAQAFEKIEGFETPDPFPADVQKSHQKYLDLCASANIKIRYSISKQQFIVDEGWIDRDESEILFSTFKPKEVVLVTFEKYGGRDEVLKREASEIVSLLHELGYRRVVISSSGSGLPTMDWVVLDSNLADWKKTNKIK